MDPFRFPDEGDAAGATPASTTPEAADEVEIEVVDDTPDPDKGRKPLEKEPLEPTEDELESYSDKVKLRIKELTHARHDERRAKEAVVREQEELRRVAQRLLDENKRLKEYVTVGEKQFAETATSAADSSLEVAKQRYRQAYEAGDAEALLAAQEALTDAKLRKEAAKNFKPLALQEATDDVQLPASQPQPSQVDEKTVRWQAKNQWFGAPGYEEVTSFSLGLHQKLVNSGVDPRSDEYFERIDARLRSVFPEVVGGADSKGSKKPPSTVVAPVTRATGARKVQLTASQVALAKRLNLTPQQYVAEVLRLEKANG
jgi:hypothetical protein